MEEIMKNLLEIVTTKDDSQEMPLNRFAIKSASQDLLEEKDRCLEKMESTNKKSSYNWLMIIVMMLVVISVILFNRIVNADSKPIGQIIVLVFLLF